MALKIALDILPRSAGLQGVLLSALMSLAGSHGQGLDTRSKTIRTAIYAQRLFLRSAGPHIEFNSTLNPGWPRIGFLKALTLTLRVKESGLIFGGPPCGSWIFINYATHRRSPSDAFGNEERAYVKKNNSCFDCIRFFREMLAPLPC